MDGIHIDVGGAVRRQASKLVPAFDRLIEQSCIWARGA
jgi:hypothetical protein